MPSILAGLVFKRWHDFKAERVALLFSQSHCHDVICVQELYSFWWTAHWQNHFLAQARQHGFTHSISTRFPRFPAFIFNSGLVIVSRFPIAESEFHAFPTPAFYDVITTNRGVMWARVELPGQKHVSVFTFHLAPPKDEVVQRMKLLSMASCVQPIQCQQLVQFVETCIAGKNQEPVIIAGDFNFEPESSCYNVFSSLLQKRLPMPFRDDFVRKCKISDGWTATFGNLNNMGNPEETLLTHPTVYGIDSRPDHCFSSFPDEAVISAQVDKLQRPGTDRAHYQQVSDHSGLTIEYIISA